MEKKSITKELEEVDFKLSDIVCWQYRKRTMKGSVIGFYKQQLIVEVAKGIEIYVPKSKCIKSQFKMKLVD